MKRASSMKKTSSPETGYFWPALLFLLTLLLYAVLVMPRVLSLADQPLVLNTSESLARGLYLGEPGVAAIRRGLLYQLRVDYPVWVHEKTKIRPGERLLKQVVGLPGDRIDVGENGRIEICSPKAGCLRMSAPAETSSLGYALRAAELPAVIPAGHLFVYGPNSPRSLDSRLLGLVPVTAVVRQIKPLWVEKIQAPRP